MNPTILVLVVCISASFNIFVSAGHGFYMSEEFKAARDECLTESSITIEELKSGWRMDEVPEKNLCFNKCMMTKRGLINEDGVIQKDKVASAINMPFLSEDKRGEMVECIQAIEKIDACADVTKTFECFPKWQKH